MYHISIKISHNPNWHYIPDYPYRILSIGGSGLVKISLLLKLIKYQQSDVDKIYLYAKDPFKVSELRYQLLISGRKKLVIKLEKNPKAFNDYSQRIHENLGHYNSTK